MQPLLVNQPADPKPFLRWAGGKTWLVRRLRGFFPSKYGNYHEPFLGGAAVFFHLRPSGKSFLGDANVELVNAYQQLKTDPEPIINHLKGFTNDEPSYYDLRGQMSGDDAWMAARFIFLNRTSYNGIYRVNRKGSFNVPYGHDPEAPIFTAENLRAIHAALTNAEVETEDFEAVKERAEAGDLVFLDPPYTVMHSNNGFIAYNQKLFTWEDQVRLADMIRELKKRKVLFILTNAFHSSIEDLYRGVGNMIEFSRHSTITSAIEKRVQTSEYVITNLDF